MSKFKLNDKRVISIIGHLVVSNNQIHNYQTRYIFQMLARNNITDSYKYIDDIFLGNEELITKEIALMLFNNESSKVREEIFKELVIIANLDGNLDKKEKVLLDELKVNSLSKDNLMKEGRKESEDIKSLFQDEDKLKRDKLEIIPKELDEVINYINRIRDIFKQVDLPGKEKIESVHIEESIIDYEELLRISKEDFNIINEAYFELRNATEASSKKLEDAILSIDKNIKIDDSFKLGLFESKNRISDNILKKLDEMYIELLKKENSLKHFTISLLGRTKAGKSTLHTILTGEGEDSIGQGKQRTTRYNRVYQWGNLRLIDTPGIGSAEAEGRSDEEIAESIIGESDILCIVVSDDNVQRYIFELAEKIIKMNKPVIIILNHKENISDEIRYKRFKKKPDKWLDSSNTQGVHGHVERISEFAKENKFDDMVTSYPIFLLASLLAMDDKYKEDKNMLIKISNINEFKDGIKDHIKKVGILLRSQTMLDHSRALFMDSKNTLDENIMNVRILYDRLKINKSQIFDNFYKRQNQLIENVEYTLNKYYRDLEENYALDFAERYYDYKDPDNHWKTYLEDINFNEKLENAVSIDIEDFVKEIQEVLTEQLEDFQIGIDNDLYLSGADIDFINIDFNKGFKVLGGLAGVGGTIAMLLGAGPIGWGLGIGGLIIGAFSGIFKSKSRKKQEAIDKLYNNLQSNIRQSKNKSIKEILDKVESSITEELKNMEDLFNSIIDKVYLIIESGEETSIKYLEAIELLDLHYGWRILNYLSGEEISKSNIKDIIVDVDREFGKTLNIVVNQNMEYKNQKLDLIREKINITSA